MKTKILLQVALFSLLLCGCESFLKEELITGIDKKDYFNSPEDYTMALYGCYNILSTRGNPAGYGGQSGHYGRGIPTACEMGTDEVYATTSGIKQTESQEFDSYNITTGNSWLEDIWGTMYSGINRTNEVITKIDEMGADPGEFYRQIRGEAKFLRGLMYFNLVRMFGGVPLKLDASAGSDNFNIPRSTTEAVYKQIISDFKDAKDNCPPAQVQFGRATRYAAMGQLAKVYLQIASFKMHNVVSPDLYLEGDINSFEWVEDPMEYYKLARTEADELLTELGGGDAVLMPDFSHNFYPYESSREVLFEVQFASGFGNEQGGYVGSLYGPQGKSALGGGQNSMAPSDSQVKDLMDDVDNPRYTWTLCKYEIVADSEGKGTIKPDAPKQKITIGKFRIDLNPSYAQDKTPVNFPVQRVSDVCLIHAEASGEIEWSEKNYFTNETFKYLNVVRKRGGLTEYTTENFRDATLNKAMAGYDDKTDIGIFRRAIMNERKWELIGEAHRWFDLVRMGLLVDVLTELNDTEVLGTKNGQLQTIRNVKPHHIFRPIPMREVSLSQKAIIQNAGYF